MWKVECFSTGSNVQYSSDEIKTRAYVMQNDKAQDRAGYITYRNITSGDKITIMYVIDGHGLHHDYRTQIDTGNIVASFIENVITNKIDCSGRAQPDDLLSYFNDSSKGIEFYHQIQESLYEHMIEKLAEHEIEPSDDASCIWTRRGRELMIVGGSTLNIALIYETEGVLPKARIYTVGDSLIGYGDYVVDPNIDGSKLTPETVQKLREANIEAVYDVKLFTHTHIREKPIYDLSGNPYPLPVRFHLGKPEPAYYVSNVRGDIALRFTLTGVRDVKKSRYKMAPFSTMGNFGAPEVTRCPQYTEIFEVVEPLSLFSDGIGDCLKGRELTSEELDNMEVKNLTLKYPEDHILYGTARQPFNLVSTNINREVVEYWDDELYIESYRGLATSLFGAGNTDDQSFVIFKP